MTDKAESKEKTQTPDRNRLKQTMSNERGVRRERGEGSHTKEGSQAKEMELDENRKEESQGQYIGLVPSCHTTNGKDAATTLLLVCYSLCFVV